MTIDDVGADVAMLRSPRSNLRLMTLRTVILILLVSVACAELVTRRTWSFAVPGPIQNWRLLTLSQRDQKVNVDCASENVFNRRGY